MLSPRKFAASKKSLQRRQNVRKRQIKRSIQVETLEKRELLAADFSPHVRTILEAMTFANQEAYIRVGEKLEAHYAANPVVDNEPVGENSSAFNAQESEPNGSIATANLLPLGNVPGKHSVVNVTGQMNSVWDEDFYAFDLKKGDILDIRINSPMGITPGLTLFNTRGRELLHSKTLFYPPTPNLPIPDKSPRFTTGSASVSYIIDTDGRYYLSVNDAAVGYTLNMRTYRNTIELEPVGTKQKIFLDFDGATVRTDLLHIDVINETLPQSARIPGFYQILPELGLSDDDEPALIRKITSLVEKKLRFDIAQVSLNGFYPDTGNPGDFDIEIVSSLDSPDIWGQPNVSRVVIGGGLADIGVDPEVGLLGISQSIDIGNFNREETALVMLDLLLGIAETVPRAGNVPLADVFAYLVADVVAHEAAHYLGAMHQDPGTRVQTIMDPAYDPLVIAGRDGLFGTHDDEPLKFLNDAYRPTETTSGGGINNSPQILAFALATGKAGSAVTGTVFNDNNRNARLEAGEQGLAGWEVYVDLNGNGIREANEPRAITGPSGNFSLGVAPGNYTFRVVRPDGWIASTPAEEAKTVSVSTSGAVVNFGSVFPNNSVTGYKWLDLNGDGIRDPNEPGIEGVYIYLDLDGDERPDVGEPAAITRADGSYTLTPPRAGTYTIREVVGNGMRQTYPPSGAHVVTYNGTTPLSGYNFGNTESADWGDAPAPYPTTRANNGAYHGQLDGLKLGTLWDAEQDGQPSVGADGDNLNGINDEDGVIVIAPIVRGDSSNIIQIHVTNDTGSVAYVQGWIDFNGNGSWNDPGEQIVTNFAVTTTGVYNISFATPANAVTNAYARFRLSQNLNLGPAGGAAAGEVEDYLFNIVNGPRTLLQPDVATVARNSVSNRIDVLANDFAIPGEAWSISGVSSGLRGGRVSFDPATNEVLYSPPLSFIGTDEFTYTARTSTGRTETAKVTVSVVAQFTDPVAVDDSFDVPANSIGYPLNVLANDIEGRNGALVVTSVTSPSQGGTVAIGSGGQSIRYTPRRDFGGTEQLEYTATDASGKSTTARITIHVTPGSRADDLVEFSFAFLNMADEPITEIRQGEQFKVQVFVDDLRPERGQAQVPPVFVNEPGVYAAYLDILYSSGLVTPAAPSASSPLDFEAAFAPPYMDGFEGTAATPGIINEFGAFVGSTPGMNAPNAILLGTMVFSATNPGLAEFIGDPADISPELDVVFFNTDRRGVPASEIRYGRSFIEIVPTGVNFPYAKDDSPARLPAGQPSTIDVLANDISGTQPPIRITSTTQPANGQVQIFDNNTPSIFSDDRIIYTPNTNFTGTDSFTYTVTDQQGFTSTATVTVQVGTEAQVQADDVIELRLSVTDLAGVPIDQVTVGSQFQLRGYVKDLRTAPTEAGVFAAFQDILYNSNLVSVNSSGSAPFFQVVYSAGYSTGTSGDVRIPGLINEIGSTQTSNNPTGSAEQLQFVVTLTANATGTAEFIGDPADIRPFHDTLFFEPTVPLAKNQIRYTRDSVTIVNTRAGGGSGEGLQNLINAYDVNNDGHVSPIDALIVINALNASGHGPIANMTGASGEDAPKFFIDVDGDGFLTPLDVLAVVNHINGTPRTQNTSNSREAEPTGEGESSPATPLEVVNGLNSEVVEVPFETNRSTHAAVASLYAGSNIDEEKKDSDELFNFASYMQDDKEDEEDPVDLLINNLYR